MGRLLQQVLLQPLVTQVIAVDDGSTDDTAVRLAAWAARDPRVLILRHPCNRGKGAAIRTALAYVQAPFVLIQDADLEYDPADYARLLQPLLSGSADVVYGTRFGRGAAAQTPGWHRLGNGLLTVLTNTIIRAATNGRSHLLQGFPYVAFGKARSCRGWLWFLSRSHGQVGAARGAHRRGPHPSP